jgi:nucleoid-associated protein YgaU
MKRLLLAAGLLCSLSAFAVTADYNYPREKQILGFYGTLEPKPVFHPSSLNFGTVKVGEEKTQKVQVLNEGYGYLVFKKIYLRDGKQFAIKDVNCPGQLAYGQSCFITVVFKPTRNGNFTDELVLNINSDKQPVYRIPLSGSAYGAEACGPAETPALAETAAPATAETYTTGKTSYQTTTVGEYPYSYNESEIPTEVYIFDEEKGTWVKATPGKDYNEVVETPSVQTQTYTPPVVKTTPSNAVGRVATSTSSAEKIYTTTERVKTAVKTETQRVKSGYKLYTVKPCDTLWDLAAKFYGTPLLWAAIYEANKDKIRDPWIIKEGMVLKLPVYLSEEEVKKYKAESLRLMQEMADRPLGPKCPLR